MYFLVFFCIIRTENYIGDFARGNRWRRLGGPPREIDEAPSDSPRLGSPPRASAVIRAVQVVVNNSCIINVVVLQ